MKPLDEMIPVWLLATMAVIARAQDGNSTIAGCIDVRCPPATDGTNDNCTVAGRSFPGVGVTPITSDTEALSRLTWSKGVNVTDGPDGAREFGSSYYLGTPPSLDLRSTGACAIFFNGVSSSLSFETGVPNNETSDGTCSDAMGSDCVQALIDRARNFDIDDDDSNEEWCTRLRENLEENMDASCRQFQSGFWTNLTSVGAYIRIPSCSTPNTAFERSQYMMATVTELGRYYGRACIL